MLEISVVVAQLGDQQGIVLWLVDHAVLLSDSP